MRWISDAMLARGVRAPLAAVRRAAARRAAARALHEIALVAGGDDPLVLALLGMHAASLAATAEDDLGQIGHVLANAAFGRTPGADVVAGLDTRWRRRIAAALAPADAAAAAAILPAEDRIARAACLRSAAVLGDAAGIEADALRAGFAIDAGDFAHARAALNRVFAADGLSPPLPGGDAPFAIQTLAGAAQLDGGDALVSVIMPVKDGAATLAMAAGSVLRQGWRDLELILVDDGSGDASLGVAHALAARDDRVRVLANAGPAGVAGARNTGTAAARGRWIAFLDADDWAHPDRLARQIARISQGVATVSRHIRIDVAGRPVAPRVFPIVRLCPISLLADADAVRRAGPFEIARTGSDAEFLARLDVLFGRTQVTRDPAVLTVASWRAQSLSSDAARGMFAADRYAYREDWMLRHMGWVSPVGSRGDDRPLTFGGGVRGR